MLTLVAGQVESLWDEVLPVEVRELPDDLARLDRVLSDSLLLFPIAQAWQDDARSRGRPSVAMQTFVRLMVVKQRTGWGYETLVREVSDSLHLRRFCLIAIDQRVPDESTVRKLVRRLGPEVVADITRMVIEKAQRETRFIARAARIDSTVVEADIRLSVRRDARVAGRPGARARGAQAAEVDREQGAGARPFPVYRQDGPSDLQDTRQAHRRSESAGDEAQRAGWPADRPLRPGGQAARDGCESVSPRPRRPGQAPRRPAVGGVGSAVAGR
jgi:transposase, IS5 family